MQALLRSALAVLIHLVLSLPVVFAGVAVGAQPPAETTAPAAAGRARGQDDLSATLITLRVLRQSLVEKERDLRQKQDEIAAETNEQRKLALLEEAKSIESDIARMRRNLDRIMTNIDIDQLESAESKFDLEAELKELLRPLIEQVKDLTAEPRQIDKLRADLQAASDRLAIAEKGLEHIDRLLAAATDDAVRAMLADGRSRWQRRIADIRNLHTVARFQLEARQADRRSLVESFQSFVSTFFRTRGLNLLLAVGAFALVLFGMRLLYRPIARIATRRRGLYSRLLAVFYHLAVVLFSTLAALLTLYAAGDWVLLGIALIFVLGLAWAGKNTVPRFLDDIRLLLNLGPVRESERIVYEGVPWRVDRLHFFTRLSNPALTGGMLRLPIRRLAELNSRPCDDREIWFPCDEGDWVQLDDDVRGCVVLQTPDFVQLVQLGGARVTYATSDFVGKSPKNLSLGFRVKSTFGIDYGHQAISTTSVPQLMQQHLHKTLEELVPGAVTSVRVEFKVAGASSLDMEAICDFAGSVAARFEMLGRAIQRTLVDACNVHGWVIPFTQVTLHQAVPA